MTLLVWRLLKSVIGRKYEIFSIYSKWSESRVCCHCILVPMLCVLVHAQANDFGSEVIPGAKDMGMHIQVGHAVQTSINC